MITHLDRILRDENIINLQDNMISTFMLIRADKLHRRFVNYSYIIGYSIMVTLVIKGQRIII